MDGWDAAPRYDAQTTSNIPSYFFNIRTFSST